MRGREGSRPELLGEVLSTPVEKLEKRAYEALRRSKKAKFDLPMLSIRTSQVNLSGVKVLESYSVGMSTIYITRDYEYLVHDPPLTPEEQSRLRELSSKLLFLMPSSVVVDEMKFDEYLAKAGLRDRRYVYFLKREILGYGLLEPLIHDARVEDVVVASSKNPVSCIHSDYGTMPTNIVFCPDELDRYIEKLVYASGKSISLYRPIVSLRLPDGSRLSASYKKEVSPSGSNFIIRKFPEKPWSITSLMLLNTIPPEMAAWLMILQEYKKAFLVCGAMGTGKTSLINAICNLIPERSVIVTIEDTPELRLVHPNRISLVVRESTTLEERGEIGMFALVKEALRMSADYIIVGEVRGEEGKIWAQAIMTGHGGVTSLHAESPNAALERLVSPPILVERGALRSLTGIVFVGKTTIRSKDQIVQRRRAMNFYDIGNDFELSPLFRYDPNKDAFSFSEDSILQSKGAERIITETGISRSRLLDMYLKRVKFLEELKKIAKVRPEFREYGTVTKVVWAFQSSPSALDLDSLIITPEGKVQIFSEAAVKWRRHDYRDDKDNEPPQEFLVNSNCLEGGEMYVSQ
ncbi:MAG: type II/IV secretion system ATPase subunit [Candidatus Methanomethyliaceae archaeon]|nr:type II/IV secretion system ATPase subunit [Candidatus Methanomethyliaceae archaeon]